MRLSDVRIDSHRKSLAAERGREICDVPFVAFGTVCVTDEYSGCGHPVDQVRRVLCKRDENNCVRADCQSNAYQFRFLNGREHIRMLTMSK
jgi:hypothetical protein